MDIREKALLYRAHAGDRGAAGALFDQYYRDIYSYIFYRVNDSETAEELSAEVFMRMIQELPGKLEHGKPFISWLYSLARTIIKDHAWLQEMTRPKTGSGKDFVGNQKEQSRQDALTCFKRALQHLSDKQKEIIVHRFVEGRSLEDVADLVQQSERGVMELQYKALEELEKALAVEDCL